MAEVKFLVAIQSQSCSLWPWLAGYDGQVSLPAYIASHSPCHVSCLSQTVGEQHRKQRKILNPVFAISHLREMGEALFSVVMFLIEFRISADLL
jgi:cytochrome P450